VEAISFYYGQKNSIEVDVARAIAIKHNIAVTAVDLGFVSTLCEGAMFGADSNLVDGWSTFKHFVPYRNPLFLTVAAMHAAFRGIENLLIGVTKEGWEDCYDGTPDFINKMNNMLTTAVGSKIPIFIHAPFTYFMKEDVIQYAKDSGVIGDLTLAHTCVESNDEGKPCGVCEPCKIRAKGFKIVGVGDPQLQ
jgi:7-cyano-7-deazaguanine synthase